MALGDLQEVRFQHRGTSTRSTGVHPKNRKKKAMDPKNRYSKKKTIPLPPLPSGKHYLIYLHSLNRANPSPLTPHPSPLNQQPTNNKKRKT
jgi:hypothetical protein